MVEEVPGGEFAWPEEEKSSVVDWKERQRRGEDGDILQPFDTCLWCVCVPPVLLQQPKELGCGMPACQCLHLPPPVGRPDSLTSRRPNARSRLASSRGL